TAETGDRLALEACDEVVRQRPAQVAAARLDPDESRPRHHRFETAAYRFDFGQFGHAARDSAGRGRALWSQRGPHDGAARTPGLSACGSGTRATAVDVNPDMLGLGQARAAERGIKDTITFTEANAEALPFADRSFDAVSIAFGIRNVPRMQAALNEAHRVLRI